MFKCVKESQLDILDQLQTNMNQNTTGPHLEQNLVVEHLDILFRKTYMQIFLNEWLGILLSYKISPNKNKQEMKNAPGLRFLILDQIVISISLYLWLYVLNN